MVWLIVLICALLPAYQIRFKIGFLPLTLLEVLILICFFVWLLVKIKKSKLKPKTIDQTGGQDRQLLPKNWRSRPLSGPRFWSGWLILAWLVLGAAAIFIAPDLKVAAGIWKAYFLEPILFLIVLIDVVKTEKERNLVLGGLFFSAFYLSLAAIYQKFFGGAMHQTALGAGVMSQEVWGGPKVWRATSLFPQPNFLGLYLGPIVILAFGHLIFNLKKIHHSLFVVSYELLVISLSLLAIVLARSEGAIIGVFIGLIFFALFFSKTSRRISLVGLLILFLIVFIFSPSRDFLNKKISFHDLSGQLRLNIWQGAFSLFKTSPFLGVGLMGYQKLIPQYQKPYYSKTGELISVETHPYPHNLFLSIWFELGILGLIVFLWILIKFFKEGFKLIKKLEIRNLKLEIAIMASMITIIVHGLVDTPYFKNDLSVLFWLIIGLGMVENQLSISDFVNE